MIENDTIESIVEDQYYLASMAGINLTESSLLPDFERGAFVNLVAKTIKDRTNKNISA